MNVSKEIFDHMPDGRAVYCWRLQEESGIFAEVLDYGAAIRKICVPDRSGALTDVVLGYDTLEEYLYSDGNFGAVCGRFANRIGGGRFTLNGKEYVLAQNNGPNHLHGGIVGFDKKCWSGEAKENGVRFSLTSPDGEEGYPGNLQAQVLVTLQNGTLTLHYEACCDQDTVLNLTNHSFFNLCGEGEILSHRLTLAAECYTPADENCLPTGEILPVEGTPLDFRREHAIGSRIGSDHPCISKGGYDSNMVLSGSPAAVLRSEESGIVMTVTTDQPGLQFYTANWLTPRKGKNGLTYDARHGVCFETQCFPDSIHHPDWPSCILRTGEVFRSETTFAFTVKA